MKIPFEKIFEADLIHPLEETFLRACQKNPLFDGLATEAAGLKSRTVDAAQSSLDMFPVTKLTAPRLNRLYETALERLGCRERYPLFFKFDYAIKYEVSGSDEDSCIITVSDAADELSDKEILALLGQALGRIKCAHVSNLQFLKILSGMAHMLPLGEVAGKALLGAFTEWFIAAQFSTDRAALFVSGSERAVASLLMKQSGAQIFDMQEILLRKISRPRELGVYFVWLMQSLPSFGAVERIQMLRRWIRSEKFRRDYPGLYFNALMEDDTADEENFPQLELHRAAGEGNVQAAVSLAEKYLNGEGVPQSRFMAEQLFKAATFGGDARAMYIFATMLELFHDAPSKIVRRLLEVSARRGFEPARKKIGDIFKDEELAEVSTVCAAFEATYRNRTLCKTKFDGDTQKRLRAAFWLNPDEKIFAAETVSADSETCGIALTSSAVYGRLSLEVLPFRFSWREIARAGLYRQQFRDGKNYLTVGDEPIYQVGNFFHGTAAELLIQLVQS